MLFFCYVAPANVDLTIKVNIPITSILIPTIFRTFDVKSGHFPHLASPEREYPGRHSAHRVPVYPSVQLPFGSDKLLGGGSQP